MTNDGEVEAGADLGSVPVAGHSVHELEVRQAPGLVEPRLQRRVQTKVHKPAVVRLRGHVVLLEAGWRLGTDVEIDGAVIIDDKVVRAVPTGARDRA